MNPTSELFEKVKAEIDNAPGELPQDRLKHVIDEYQIKELFQRISNGPAPGRRYSHYKGGHYEVIANCADEANHHHIVVYRDLRNPERVWARKFESFNEIVRKGDGVVARFAPLPQNAKIITACDEYDAEQYDTKIFLAGGITNCPNWQSLMIEYLTDENAVLFNPRRDDWPIDDPHASEAQIKWEYKYMEKADAISFWFCKETLCPITLLELGKALKGYKDVFIGCDQEYARKLDVVVQTRLERPQVEVVYSLTDLAQQIREYIRSENSWKCR